jgi:DNA-directed RNA polymerase specialized sigma24 family protein
MDQKGVLKRFVRCETGLRAFVGAVVRDVHAREDPFQEIALTLWEHHARYDPSRPSGAWARGMIRRAGGGDARHRLRGQPSGQHKVKEIRR